jgi:hypothetical protein
LVIALRRFANHAGAELIIATHGRSMFMLDVRPLETLTEPTRAAEVNLFAVRPVKLKWRVEREVPPFPPRGRASIHYWLKEPQNVTLTISNAEGQLLRTLPATSAAGLNQVVWDLRADNGKDVSTGVYQVTLRRGRLQFSTNIVVKP